MPLITNDTITLIWLILGILLMISELFIPGLIVVFFGVSSVVVAGLRWIGLLDGFLPSIVLWSVLSTILIVIFRKFFSHLLPGETSRSSTNEDLDAFGQIAEVIEMVESANNNGRIKFQGTTWSATTGGEPLKVGAKARIVCRDNTVWVVEPISNDITTI